MPSPTGSYGTVYSASREENGQEVLFPMIYDGALHSQDEAWRHYQQTGQHMGKFKSVADADAYGQKYHEDAAAGKYDQVQQIDFSKYSGAQSEAKPEGAISRFLDRATGLPVSDIAAQPGAYLNPLSRAYWLKAREESAQPTPSPTLRQMVPFGQTAKDIADKNYAGAAGDIAPGVVAAASMMRFGRPGPEVISPRALPRGPIEAPGTIEASPAPAYSPTTRAERLNLLLPKQAGSKIPLPASTAEAPAESEASYPSALQKRPTDRAEIVSDKAVEDAMRNDLEKQGWRALSQERKEFYANNQPGMAKGDLITNARVEAVRTAAEEQVQKILAEANPPIKYTKTVIPKAKVTTAAQPVADDLNSPNRLVDLMQQSIDAVNARKGKK